MLIFFNTFYLYFQIDGSTLRTLCIQHGPLVTFHLYLNQGIALCKYATREEANKAQMALNKCVLGNTTIFAELPSETEVLNILQHLPQTSSSANSVIISTGTNVSGNSSSGVGGATVANVSSSSGTCSSNGNNGSGSGNGGLMASTATANNPTSSGNSASGSVNSVSSSGNSNSGGGNTNSANVIVSVNGGSVASGSNVSKNVSGTNSIAMSTVQPNVSNVTSSTGSNSTWRQTTQNQNQALQGQNRPSGREADYDYISQYVCSIVDD